MQMLSFRNTTQDLKEFEEGVKKREIHFMAISGQHSAKAASYIKQWSNQKCWHSKIWPPEVGDA